MMTLLGRVLVTLARSLVVPIYSNNSPALCLQLPFIIVMKQGRSQDFPLGGGEDFFR